MASRSQPPFSSLKLLNACRSVKSVEDPIPPGFLSVRQWAEKWKLSEVQTQRLLSDGIEGGFVTMKKLRVNVGRRIYPVPHYSAK